MPTLLNPSQNSGADDNDDDGSVTILLEDHETIENPYTSKSTPMASRRSEPAMHQTPLSGNRRQQDKSVTFDDNSILCSTSKPHPASASSFSYKRRRGTLDSEVSLSLDDFHRTQEVEGFEEKNASTIANEEKYPFPPPSPVSIQYPYEDIEELPWPNRDEYRRNHHDFVKGTIADFQKKYPGKLRDYRSMSPEEKACEQQRVLGLLTRLGISKGSSNKLSDGQHYETKCLMNSTPDRDNKNILDEMMSPAFTPSPCRKVAAQRCSKGKDQPYEAIPFNSPAVLREDAADAEISELLLSRDIDPIETLNDDCQQNSAAHLGDSFEFPLADVRNSDSSMELVRQAPRDDHVSFHDEDDASQETPENKIIQKSSNKRLASTSGKRGADIVRKRPNGDDYDMDIANRLGRLSLSPMDKSPPGNIFATSQSPISPKLTYNTPSDERKLGQRLRESGTTTIDWGRESDDRRRSSFSVDSLATNTPPYRYRSEKDKTRSFREVPLNVSLKNDSVFHIDKLSVRKAAQTRATRPAKSRMAAVQNRRLVNFPDPLSRYNKRTRSALKEIYSTIRAAERDFVLTEPPMPAAGVFFSMSEQRIIDVSIKLLLQDLSEKSRFESATNTSTFLRGNTLIVVRSKNDTATWERALREQSGCSVSNHATLPLAERIRPSSAEKACAYDVVLTTYDSMKSPDMAVPVTKDGHAILSNVRDSSGWHSSRTQSQFDSASQPTKQFSILHRINFKRVIFVDILGRKCYLAKGGTARASASVALSGDSRVVFFEESDADGADPLRALRKSDQRAYESVIKVLRLTAPIEEEDSSHDEDERMVSNPLELIAVDFNEIG